MQGLAYVMVPAVKADQLNIRSLSPSNLDNMSPRSSVASRGGRGGALSANPSYVPKCPSRAYKDTERLHIAKQLCHKSMGCVGVLNVAETNGKRDQ